MSNHHYTTLGRIGKTYGIKGWFHVIAFPEAQRHIFEHATWYLKDRDLWQPLKLEAHRAHGAGFIAKLEGYDTPEATRLLTNREIGVPEAELPPLNEDEYYWSDLINLEVYTQENVYLGLVTQLLETGANDVLCVKGERERALPYIESVIKKVDLKQKRITVDWDPEF